MKRCPKCKREYQDELNFCPDDQSALIGLQPKGSPMVGKIFSKGDVNITVNQTSDNDKAIEEVLENRESIEEVNQKIDNLSNNINKLFAPKSPKGTEPIPVIKESQLNELRKFDDLQKQNSEKKKKDFAQQIKNDAILESVVANKEGKDTKAGCGCWVLAAGLFGLLIMWNKFNGCTFSTLSSEEIYQDHQEQSSLKNENNNLKKQLEEEKNLRKANEEKNKFEKEFINKSNKTQNFKNYHAGEHKQNSEAVRRIQQIELEELRRTEARKRQEWERKELERKKAQELAHIQELKKIAELKKTHLVNLKYIYLNFLREYWIERGAIKAYKKKNMLVRGPNGHSTKYGSPDIGVWFWRQDWMEQLLLNCYESHGLRSDLELLQGELLKQFLETFKKLFPSKRVFNVTRVQDLYSLLSANDKSLFDITLRQLSPTLDKKLSILFHNIDKTPPQLRPHWHDPDDKSSSSYQPSPSDFMKALLPSSSLQKAFEEEFRKINWSRENGYQFNPFTH